MRQIRLSERVADELRDEILKGSFREGDRLDGQDALLERFNVSMPSIREALGILELEGLVTVQRGKFGGAVVHRPDAARVAYMTALVLESRQSPLADVAEALRFLEPVCAALCAARPDRATTVVPSLRAAVNDEGDTIDDPVEYSLSNRRFHLAIVTECGNESLSLVGGSLAQIWTSHLHEWTETVQQPQNRFPAADVIKSIVHAHRKILEAIEAGDQAEATRVMSQHVMRAHTYHLQERQGEAIVKCGAVRNQLLRGA